LLLGNGCDVGDLPTSFYEVGSHHRDLLSVTHDANATTPLRLLHATAAAATAA
jgi:hypothetical protein